MVFRRSFRVVYHKKRCNAFRGKTKYIYLTIQLLQECVLLIMGTPWECPSPSSSSIAIVISVALTGRLGLRYSLIQVVLLLSSLSRSQWYSFVVAVGRRLSSSSRSTVAVVDGPRCACSLQSSLVDDARLGPVVGFPHLSVRSGRSDTRALEESIGYARVELRFRPVDALFFKSRIVPQRRAEGGGLVVVVVVLVTFLVACHRA